MEAKISNSIHNEDIRRTFQSFSNFPQNLRIICKSEETIWANKFVLSFQSPYLCTLINQTNHLADYLLLPDFSAFVINLLFSVINTGFCKANIPQEQLNDIFECAKALQIDLNRSNASIDFIEAHVNGADDVIGLQSDMDSSCNTDDFELSTQLQEDSDKSTPNSKMCIKEGLKSDINIKKELVENVNIKKEPNIKEEYIKKELKEYWGIAEESIGDMGEVSDMELCSEYVEFGDTLSEIEQFQEAPKSLEFEDTLTPEAPKSSEFGDTLTGREKCQQSPRSSTEQKRQVKNPEQIISIQEHEQPHPENINEPVFRTSNFEYLHSSEQIKDTQNFELENVSSQEVDNTYHSSQNEKQSNNIKNSLEQQNYPGNISTEFQTYENLLEHPSQNHGEIGEDTPTFPSYLEQIHRLDTTLAQFSQNQDSKQQSEDLEGIDSALTNIKSKLMEISVKEIKKETPYSQEIQMPFDLRTSVKTELTVDSRVDVFDDNLDESVGDILDKWGMQNVKERKIGKKRKRNEKTEEMLTLGYLSNDLSKQDVMPPQKISKIDEFGKNIPRKSNIINFNPTFRGKLQNFIEQKGVDFHGNDWERLNTSLKRGFFSDSLTVHGNKVKNTKNIDDNEAKGNEFECQLCPYKNNEISHTQRHYITSHFRDDLLKYCDRIKQKCNICDESFKKTFEIVTHLVMMHDQLNVILKEKGLQSLSTGRSQFKENSETSEEMAKQAQNVEHSIDVDELFRNDETPLKLNRVDLITELLQSDEGKNDKMVEDTGGLDKTTRNRIEVKKLSRSLIKEKMNPPKPKKLNGFNRKKSKTSMENKSLVFETNEIRNESAPRAQTFTDVDTKLELTMDDIIQKYKNYTSESKQNVKDNYKLDQQSKHEEIAKEHQIENIVSKIKFISPNKGKLKQVKCQTCSWNGSTPQELEEHMKNCKTIDNDFTKTSEEKGNPIKETNNSFECSICRKHFKNAMFLSIHSNLCF